MTASQTPQTTPATEAEATAGGDSARSNRLRRLAAISSITLAATLVGSKLVAELLTGSVAVLSTLLDSIADLAASMITMICVSRSIRPPTRSFRYGQGKAEPLSALGQSAFIGASGIFILVDAGGRFIDPQPIERAGIGIGVMILALVLTAAVVLFQRHVVKVTDSPAIEADSLNFTGDLVTGVSVLAALVLVELTHVLWLDPLVATGVALFLLRNAAMIGRDAVGMLLDRELPAEERERIFEIVRGQPQVKDLHDVRSRRAGTHRFIELHLEIDGQLSLSEAHTIAHRVEAALLSDFPDADVLIHQEPAGLKDARLDNRLAVG
ncbi:MAG: cation diffusion facilitator family transporter [Alphaproteobacteria bacterium]|jgi:ferrous-iron efflux pump FieF|nr:cation diffusion facilitator family transporter [Alphaproteobacteria bacterium]